MKNVFSKIIIFILIILMLSSMSFAAIVSDNDGAAFVTKAEFEALKKNFASQVDQYNISIDGKIDGAIASYLAGTAKKKLPFKSILENFDINRRTFVQSISNPTSSGQGDIYISTNGFWIWCFPTPYPLTGNTFGRFHGYAFVGFNNYEGGHQKMLLEKNNGKSGKYIFVDEVSLGVNKYPYIYDTYRKDLKYKIVSSGAYCLEYTTAPSEAPTSTFNYGGPTSITWTNTYNWSGNSNRNVSATGNQKVNAQEALILLVNDDDYDTTKSGVQEIPWVKCIGGSTIFTSNTGSLYKKDQYEWTYDMTNFHIGQSAKQVLLSDRPGSYTWNNANPSGNYLNLNFKMPKISMIAGNNLVVNDVSNYVGIPSYYYSGLPIYQLPKEIEHLNMKFQVVINKSTSTDTSGVVFAIKNKQFGNMAISSESSDDIVFKKEYSATEIPDEIEVDLDEDKLEDLKNKTIWVKVNATNTNCSVTLVPKDMYYY